MLLTPVNTDELCSAIRAHSRLRLRGAGTKPRLSMAEKEEPVLSLQGLRGITEYDPAEFTFTALAGTPLREIVAALAERGQYLPWDPPLVESGATLGGTIAAGLSGPGRFRFGGLRDFILAVQFADGEGRLLRAGAKVVKNAAGFDVPKFLVGSLGRSAAIVEATFKVFPRPPARLTLRVPCESVPQAIERLAAAANSRWELEALDFAPEELAVSARIAGPAEANAAIVGEIAAKWPGTVTLDPDKAEARWRDAGEFRWAGEFLAKVPVTLGKLTAFLDAMAKLAGPSVRVSGGGDLAWVSLPPATEAGTFDAVLKSHGLPALVLRGEAPMRLGPWREQEIERRVRAVFDPGGRFD